MDERHRLPQLNAVVPEGVDEAGVRRTLLKPTASKSVPASKAAGCRIWRIGLMGASSWPGPDRVLDTGQTLGRRA